VLAELGGKLRESLRKLHASAAVAGGSGSGGDGSDNETDEQKLERKISTVASEISRALIEADVNVKIVMKLRDTIVHRCRQEVVVVDSSGGGKSSGNHRRFANANISPTKLVQKIVVEELIALVSPSSSSSAGNKDRALKRGKTNVVLFVGLQGTAKRRVDFAFTCV
jgi:signal recognition particle subunit SRP54